MSKYSGRDIAIEAIKIVEEFGELNMTELIKVLIERMKPDGHDMEIIKNRNDTYFSQKVRNLKSHHNKEFFNNVSYSDVDGVTKYRSLEFEKQSRTLSKKEITKVLDDKRHRTKKFYARKVEFDKLNAERKEIGDKGEMLVYDDQKNKIKIFAPELVKKIKHVSKKDGDGAGFDILSFDDRGSINYIEVKTTKGKKETPFYMSLNEYDFYQLHKASFVIARVYNFDTNFCTGEIEYIKGSEFDAHFVKEINSYKIKFK